MGSNSRVSTSMGIEMVSPSNGMVYLMSLDNESLGSCQIPGEVLVGAFYYFFASARSYRNCNKCDPYISFMLPEKHVL